MSFAVSILEQGLIYGILALGIYITYKILDFPDLTVDGSFPLGAAVTALMITKGANPYLTLPAAFAAGVGSRYLYRTDPCQMQGKRSAFRYHYDDSCSGRSTFVWQEQPMYRCFPRRQSLKMIHWISCFRQDFPLTLHCSSF